MSRKFRTEATLLNDIKSFILTIKKETSTTQPKKFSLSPLVTEYKLHHMIIKALSDKGFIRVVGKGMGRKIQWAYGSGDITEAVLKDLHKHYNAIQHTKQTERAVKGATKPEDTQVKAEPVKLKVEQKPKQQKVKSDTTTLPFKEIKGTIFGYKQLRFMKQTFSDKEFSVVIDKRYAIPSVQMIQYLVEGSNLRIMFFMYAHKHNVDVSSNIGVIELHNTVLAFNEVVEDGAHVLEIQTIPVSDPYEIKM